MGGITAARGLFPVDVIHETIDVVPGRRGEVHVVGMLIHVHHQQRRGGGRRMHVIRHPEILQRPGMLVPAQHDPARTTAQTGTDASEFPVPGIEIAELSD